MSTNTNTNAAVIDNGANIDADNYLTATSANKKDVAALPRVAVASIHSMSNKGTLKEGKLIVSAFYIAVKISADWKDINGKLHKAGEWRTESEWIVLAGQKTTKRVYTGENGVAIEKARKAKEAIRAWGIAVPKKESKPKKTAFDRAKEAFSKLTEEERKALLSA